MALMQSRGRRWTLVLAAGALLSTTAAVSAATYNSTNWYVSGRVGVGTNTPAVRLSVIGGAPWTSKGWVGSVELSNKGAIGWRANSAGQRFGMGHDDSGFTFFRTAANPGTSTATTVNDLFINNVGRVSIAAGTPAHRLSVGSGPAWTTSAWSGAVELTNGSAIGWRPNSDGVSFGMGHTNGSFHIFRTTSAPGTTAQNATYALSINDNGNVGIGVLVPAYRLHVDGSAWVENGDFYVTGGNIYVGGTKMNVPDYVFEPEYRLRSLDDLRSYVAENRHLPNVPAEKEIRAGNLDLAGFQMRLLEKIEELTLYTLTQDEQLKSQQHQIDSLQQENQAILRRLADFETRLAALPEGVKLADDAR